MSEPADYLRSIQLTDEQLYGLTKTYEAEHRALPSSRTESEVYRALIELRHLRVILRDLNDRVYNVETKSFGPLPGDPSTLPQTKPADFSLANMPASSVKEEEDGTLEALLEGIRQHVKDQTEVLQAPAEPLVRHRIAGLEAALNSANAELELARPVLEAARKWKEYYEGHYGADHQNGRKSRILMSDAVKAWELAQ
jgi:hypothetical protein